MERFLSIVAGHPLLQVCSSLGVLVIGLRGLDLMIRNLLVYFRLEAKCSALSYKTPLGIEHNGSEHKTPCDMKKHTIFVFLLLIVYTM